MYVTGSNIQSTLVIVLLLCDITFMIVYNILHVDYYYFIHMVSIVIFSNLVNYLSICDSGTVQKIVPSCQPVLRTMYLQPTLLYLRFNDVIMGFIACLLITVCGRVAAGHEC